MNTLIFATNNLHKIKEVNEILHNQYKIASLADLGFNEDIPETALTLEGNASQKAWFIYNRFGKDCFADDTGLEVDALNGEPGVYSARYAGHGHDFNQNVIKLLHNLDGKANRKARFRTVISLIIKGNETQFEGIINGEIITERRGNEGFGYDPVFVPEGYSQTFAEMPAIYKNEISHRALAMHKMADFLKI
ncbi:MAG: non-canonical purine NTP diphosphatase [Lentimicrobiaceae bacterium]